MKKIFYTLFILGLFCTKVYAEEVPFEMTVGRTNLQLGQSTELSMTFTDSQSVPAPQIPSKDGLEAQYYGPSKRMNIISGNISRSVTHRYGLRPLKEGTFNLGPFSFDYRGKTYVSNKVVLTVSASGATSSSAGGTSVRGSAQVGDVSLEDYVYMKVTPAKTTAYINEVIPVNIKLFINRFSVREIQYPELSHDGFSMDEFAEPKQYREVVNGEYVDVVEFNTSVFATRPGELALGPAELSCSLLLKRQSRRRSRSGFDSFFGDDFFDSFFGGYDKKPITVNAPEIKINVLDLPEAGRPESFQGALGNYRFNVQAAPRNVKVGDPVTVKMQIFGSGNLNTVNEPVFEPADGFKIYDPQIKQTDQGKVFEQIFMPVSDEVTEVPAVEFSFFDINKGEYRVFREGPFPITVEPGEQTSGIKIVEMEQETAKPVVKEVLGRDIIHIKADPGHIKKKGEYLFQKPLFAGINVSTLLLFCAGLFIDTRRKKLRSDTDFARKYHAPKKARKSMARAKSALSGDDVEKFYSEVYQALRDYLSGIMNISAAGVTVDVVDSLLSQGRITAEAADLLKKIFTECDAARYAASQFDKSAMKNTFKELKEAFEYLERIKK